MTAVQIIIPVIAGVIGGFVGIYLHGRITKDVKILLAFSGAYLFALTVLHLLPDIFHIAGHSVGYFILIGFLLQILLDYFSKGVEHGHIHHSDQESKTFPLGIFISLFLHSMLEGLPISGGEALSHHHDHGGHGNALLIGIAIHKIPEALALAALLYHFYASKRKVIWYILIYSTATPIGILAGYFLVKSEIENPDVLYARILAVAVGIFIHVSTTIIFEADEHHNLSWKKITAILLGLGLVLLI